MAVASHFRQSRVHTIHLKSDQKNTSFNLITQATKKEQELQNQASVVQKTDAIQSPNEKPQLPYH